ncbi:HK97-gp10 family putative phage morphogenesis protein [Rhizobium sp. G21]|uniref:HK97-gp10 family putative phage morphogenesis protein n=1 Tax=Rhizobium sp. G21 TaxID=2758439 RepID=UPI001603CC07|nr:HK97-gp10 family putative phage morphogenesis protein [Rhizobium sp. G21]MBB1247455.1 HK97 gp10 family phage protein [Rhizobium sp. G21]
MKIEGRDRLRRRIAEIPIETRKEIRKALDSGSEEMVGLARGFVPKKSGALARSIGKSWGSYRAANANVRGVNSGGGGHDLSVVVHAGDAEAWYAALVEFGTQPHKIGGRFAGSQHPGTSPQPFFLPAWRLTRKRMKRKLATAMSRAIRKSKTS